MRKLIFLLLPLSMIAFSCSKDNDQPVPTEFNGIEGEWEYSNFTKISYDSTGKWRGTYSITHYTQRSILKFNPQGIVEELEKHNGKTTASGTYSLINNNLKINIGSGYHIHTGNYYLDTLSSTKLSMIDTVYNPPLLPGGYDIPGGYEVQIVKAVR